MGRKTRVEEPCFPCFQIGQRLICFSNIMSNFRFSAVEVPANGPTKHRARQKITGMTHKPFLLAIFNLLHCPFNLNAKGKKEISISSSAYSLYGEMLDNSRYL